MSFFPSVKQKLKYLCFPLFNSILLGQSRDGVVYSTDDYFRQQDGYTYDAAELGDAHEWNQKRGLNA